MPTAFRDRTEAGRLLAEQLAAYAGRPDVLVLALPRGGVPVAYEVARALEAPLDVFVVRKLGVPGHEELAMGAIASGGVCVLNDDVVEALSIPSQRDRGRRRAGAPRAGTPRAGLPRRPPATRGPRPHCDPGGRRARDRLDDAGRRRRPAPARARPHHRGRPDRGPLDLRGVPPRGGRVRLRHHAGPVLRRRASGTRTSPRRPTTRSATSSEQVRQRDASPRWVTLRRSRDEDRSHCRMSRTTC